MTQTTISKPGSKEYTAHYATYINKVEGTDLVAALEESGDHFLDFIKGVPENKLDYQYAEDKWTIREIIVHLMDAERIFTYRALRFSRNDRTALAGFDENEYVPASNASARSIKSLIGEYTALRQSTIAFYRNITDDMSQRVGIACGREISVRALGYAIVGHEMHHMAVIRERYL